MKIIQELDTTTIRQTVTFSASPEQVYEVIMDSKKHESLSGEKASISTEIGGAPTGDITPTVLRAPSVISRVEPGSTSLA